MQDSHKSIVAFRATARRRRRGAVSRRKVGDSQRSRIGRKNGRERERDRERQRGREGVRKGIMHRAAGKKGTERHPTDGAAARRNADAVSLVRSQAHPLTPSLGRL